jgi:oligopeptide transport system permease protein
VSAHRRGRPGTRLAAVLLLLVVLLALGAPLLPLPHPAALAPQAAGRPPDAAWADGAPAARALSREEHPAADAVRRALFGDRELRGALGTDALGRDVLARLVWGARVSLLVGLIATLVSVVIGVSWGLLAGYLGGRVDSVLMRIVDVLYAVPLLFLVILLVALLRDHAARLAAVGITREVVLYVVIGAISWLTMARIVRGQVLSLRQREFVAAARALGAGGGRIMLRHILPHLWGLVIVYLTLTVPRVMLFEAFLSFLGLGVEAPGVSWGMLASEGLEQLTAVSVSWWLVVFPGLALVLTLSSLNALGDALRDRLDPRGSRL